MRSPVRLSLCAALLIVAVPSIGCSDQESTATKVTDAEDGVIVEEGETEGATGEGTGAGSYAVPGGSGGSEGAAKIEPAGSPPAGSPPAGSPPAGSPPAAPPPAPAARPASCPAAATVENDDNATFEKATSIADGASSFCGAIAPGDVDHFSFVLPADAKTFSWNVRWTKVVGAAITVTSEGITRRADEGFPFNPGKRYVVALSGAAGAAEYTISLDITR